MRVLPGYVAQVGHLGYGLLQVLETSPIILFGDDLTIYGSVYCNVMDGLHCASHLLHLGPRVIPDQERKAGSEYSNGATHSGPPIDETHAAPNAIRSCINSAGFKVTAICGR